jgi:hypothetical protein
LVDVRNRDRHKVPALAATIRTQSQ